MIDVNELLFGLIFSKIEYEHRIWWYNGHSKRKCISSSMFLLPKFWQNLQIRFYLLNIPRWPSIARLWLLHLNLANAFTWRFQFMTSKYISVVSDNLNREYVCSFEVLPISAYMPWCAISVILCSNNLINSLSFPTPWFCHACYDIQQNIHAYTHSTHTQSHICV